MPMAHEFQADIDAVDRIGSVPAMLDIVCAVTGMRFGAVARVTEDRWIACKVKDDISLGLKPGGELDIQSTICHEIRQSQAAVAIDHVDQDEVFRHHRTPLIYGFQSYISMPIILPRGAFFGTLCAIDPKPARVNNRTTLGMFGLFSELIALRLDNIDRANAANRKEAEPFDFFVKNAGRDANKLRRVEGGATHIRELKQMLAQLEEAARNGLGLDISPRFGEVLDAALQYQRNKAESTASTPDHPFRIVMGFDGDKAAEVVALAADLFMAKTLFEEAAKQHPRQMIRLYQGANLIAEASALRKTR
jgi:GAF domain-containing protein